MVDLTISTGSYVLLVATVVSLLSAVRIYLARDLSGLAKLPRCGIIITLLGGFWMTASALEQFAPSYSAKLFWSTVQYIPIAFIPPAWFYYSLLHSPDEGKQMSWLKLPLLVTPCLVSVLVLTNSFHSFFWETPIFMGPSQQLDKAFNPGFPILISYVLLVLLAGALQLLQTRRHAHSLSASTSLYALLALIFPVAGIVTYRLTDQIAAGIDHAPLGFAISTWIIAWKLPKLRLSQIVDLSQDYVLDHMHDVVIILDNSGRILKTNRSARDLLKKYSLKFEGEHLKEILPGFEENLQGSDDPPSSVLSLETDAQIRYYEPAISRISRFGRETAGSVVVLHEITDRVQAEHMIQEGEERYRRIVEGTGAILITVDKRGKILYANESAEKLIGPGDGGTIIGELYLRYVHPDDRDWVAEFYLNQILEGVEATRIEFRVVNASGEVTWLSFIADSWKRGGEVSGVTGIAQDITEKKMTEFGLLQSEERYALAARGANDGLWDWDLDREYIYFSPRWEQMIGCKEASVEHNPEAWFSRIHPEDLMQLKSEINKHIEGDDNHLQIEYRIQHVDGSFLWMLCRGLVVRDRNGKAFRIAGSQTDITDRKRAETQLLHDAFHDSLTGLPNRTLFMDRLERMVERSKRYPEHCFSVLYLDIDRFKEVNDQFGHSVGDRVLFDMAGRLKKCIRTADTIARHGGDEFAILIEEVHDISESTLVAQRIQGELALPLILEGYEISLSASIGIVLSQSGYEDPESIMRDADIAMYRAKDNGKARYEIFDISMRDQLFARIELENALREAVEKDHLVLHYQPIISLHDDQLTGFEALVRWEHPQKGLISPGEFIPLAEETGLIREIDRWVLQTAARQLGEWQSQYPVVVPLSMSVNVSGRNFSDPDLVPYINKVLDETGIFPSSLHLEITESTLMENAEDSGEHLLQLKALGVEIQIDDFGTGYSSLGYLQQFPIDTIKVDRSFVTKIGSAQDQTEIVQTILGLAESLGMQAIAEGVETLSQRDLLRSLNCAFGQGYYYSKAVSADQIPIFLKDGVLAPKLAV